MNKYKKLAVVSLASLVVLAGCKQKSNDEQQNTTTTTQETTKQEVKTETKKEIKPEEVYKEQLLQIKQLIEGKNFEASPINFRETIGQIIKGEIKASEIKYSYYDIDKDGIEEMIVSKSSSLNSLLAIYTYKDEKVVSVLPEQISLGYRAHYYIYSDGSVVMEGSDSAFSGALNIFKYSNGQLNEVEKYERKNSEYVKGNEHLQYDDIKNKYLSAGLLDTNLLKWQSIIDFSIDGKPTHNLDEAQKLVNKTSLYSNFVKQGFGNADYAMIFFFGDKYEQLSKGSSGRTVRATSLADIVDFYNEIYPGSYNADTVYSDVERLAKVYGKTIVKVNGSFKDNKKEAEQKVTSKTILYYENDKIFVDVAEGGAGVGISVTPKDKWTITDDGIVIPVTEGGSSGGPSGKYILKFNNKQYTGGKERSKYYIEKIEK